MRLALAGDEDLERAAALGGHVGEVEVLDVDLLGAQRLRDSRQHAGTVGHVHLEAVERAGIRVGLLEQAAAVHGRLADPACEVAGIALLEGSLELLHAPPVLGERRPQRVRVVEEDVDPDPRVRSGHTGHVPERAARRRQRLVPVDARRAHLVQEQIGDRVR